MQKLVRVNLVGIVNLSVEELNAFQEDIKILTDDNYARLKEEILADGFSFSPHVFSGEDGSWWLLDGHQRRSCLLRMKEEGYSIPSIPCMEVSADSLEHARSLVLAGTSQYGTFQVKKLADFTRKTGLEPKAVMARFALPVIGFDKIIGVSGHTRNIGGEDVDAYSKKIQSPIYEPKGEKPEVSELFDESKADELEHAIDKADLPADVREFLLTAAQRHVVFNYEKIAEFYAHAPKEVQTLMEQSALVIIDFKKAIENGFVVMSREIAEAYPDAE